MLSYRLMMINEADRTRVEEIVKLNATITVSLFKISLAAE